MRNTIISIILITIISVLLVTVCYAEVGDNLEPKAVKIGEYGEMVESEEDVGRVWVQYSSDVYSKYGCSTAVINYTNPTMSNIGVRFRIGIFDDKLVKYFGTTLRSDEECYDLALEGLAAIKNGINPGCAKKLIDYGLLSGSIIEIIEMDKEEIASSLAENGFLGLSAEEILNLDEYDVKNFSEEKKLTLALLGSYDPSRFYQIIHESGIIYPGYALYEADLYALPGTSTFPKGDYEAMFMLTGYNHNIGEFSDLDINMPVILHVEEDLSKELQEKYGVTLLEKVN